MLKEAGRKKPKKYKGSYIYCEACKRKIYIEELEETGNIEQCGDIRIAYCECGNEQEI